jgi:hypothetical protein
MEINSKQKNCGSIDLHVELFADKVSQIQWNFCRALNTISTTNYPCWESINSNVIRLLLLCTDFPYCQSTTPIVIQILLLWIDYSHCESTTRIVNRLLVLWIDYSYCESIIPILWICCSSCVHIMLAKNFLYCTYSRVLNDTYQYLLVWAIQYSRLAWEYANNCMYANLNCTRAIP